MSQEIIDEKVLELIDRSLLEHPDIGYVSLEGRIRLRKELFNAVRRMDVLSDLLEDDSITEIMINGYDQIFVEKDGRIQSFSQSFESEDRLASIIQQIVAGCNRLVNEAVPIVDARLPDGSRVNVVLPPVALDGPTMTIRKFPKEKMTMERLIELGALDEEAAGFLKLLVKARYNIFVSGGTGAGKTTFLNALSDYIPKTERIITIEDSAAIDMLTAMNTGHDGSLSTGHANSAYDMITRLESMVLMGIELPMEAVRRQIASAVDIIIHLGRLRDGSRKVTEICEVTGIENGQVQLMSLYEFEEQAEKGRKTVQGHLKKKAALQNKEKLKRAGLE